MNFFGSAPVDSNEDDSDMAFSDTITIFPENVAEILSSLQSFSCLGALNIEFSYTYDVMPKGLDLTSPEESDDEVRNAEENEAWRALMAKTYKALAKNREK